MIRIFEYKLPLDLRESLRVCSECGNTIPRWHAQHVATGDNYLEWKIQPMFGLPSYIRIYLRQQRPEYTLLTLYINRPLRFVDPFQRCEKTYRDFAHRLDERR